MLLFVFNQVYFAKKTQFLWAIRYYIHFFAKKLRRENVKFNLIAIFFIKQQNQIILIILNSYIFIF